MPCYNEVAHIPLFVHHPDFRSLAGSRTDALTQTMDLMPTLLETFGAVVPPEVTAKSLLKVLEGDVASREAAIYGVFGSAVNVTDGRYTYFMYPPDLHGGNLFQYTLMPMHLKELFSLGELEEATLAAPNAFTRNVPVMRVPATPKSPFYNHQGPGVQHDAATVLFDLHTDPGQLRPIRDPAIEARMQGLAIGQMQRAMAPPEYYRRLGLAPAANPAMEAMPL